MNRKGQLRTGQFKIDYEVRYRLSVELRSFQQSFFVIITPLCFYKPGDSVTYLL